MKYKAEIVDLGALGPKARFWVNTAHRKKIADQLCPSSRNTVTFLGSGDFHHISSILISAFHEPISLVSFDGHPDWSVFPFSLNCGSWVARTLRNKNILKCILVGMNSRSTLSFAVQTGDLRSLKDNRVEIYPHSHVPSAIFFRKVPENISARSENRIFFTKIYWDELRKKDLSGFFRDIITRLPTKSVYVSIDKDCLKKEYALTNWQKGSFTLEELLVMVRIIKENTEIIGADISGDYSPIFAEDPVKRVISRFDHPRMFSAKGMSESRIKAINEATNIEIVKSLLS